MPGKVKVRVLAARNLPVMDRSSDTTDAFVELKLAETSFKTDVCRKSLHPRWDSDWFRFDVDDRELQDEQLQIRIMDYDTYSANDAIGKVYIDLNPLLLKADDDRSSGGGNNQQIMLSGWLPIFDTMHGVRGEVNVQVKVELFSDLNKFRTSSCGVLFFCTSGVPEGYKVQCINGFVEKLLVNDDPEYQWIDKIRTPRASNEMRQALFMKLSSAVQRKIGLMALELGANAVVGYQQKFDLEGDTGIVVRGIGTAVTLSKLSASDLQTLDANPPLKDYLKDALSMSKITVHAEQAFQTMSMPLSMEAIQVIPEITRARSPGMMAMASPIGGVVGVGGVGGVVGFGGGNAIVSSLSTAFNRQMEEIANSSASVVTSTKSTWLNRKSSFKQAAKSLRSVSVTTMASRAAGMVPAPRSPPMSAHRHHRVSSVKSARSTETGRRRHGRSTSFRRAKSLSKKNSTSSPDCVMKRNDDSATGVMSLVGSFLKTSPSVSDRGANSVTTSLSTTASFDETSQSMPPLDSELDSNCPSNTGGGEKAVFDLAYDDYLLDDGDADDDDGGTSISSLESLASDEQQHQQQEKATMPSSEDPLGRRDKTEAELKVNLALCDQQKSSPIDQPSREMDDAFAGESEWAQEALRIRMDKGRGDSSCTNEVTLINTFLNKSMSMTNEGNEIRRQIADDDVQRDLDGVNPKNVFRTISDDGCSTPEPPPILTIEPPSPMPTSASPYGRKSISLHSESDDAQFYRQTTTSEDDDDPSQPSHPSESSFAKPKSSHLPSTVVSELMRETIAEEHVASPLETKTNRHNAEQLETVLIHDDKRPSPTSCSSTISATGSEGPIVPTTHPSHPTNPTTQSMSRTSGSRANIKVKRKCSSNYRNNEALYAPNDSLSNDDDDDDVSHERGQEAGGAAAGGGGRLGTLEREGKPRRRKKSNTSLPGDKRPPQQQHHQLVEVEPSLKGQGSASKEDIGGRSLSEPPNAQSLKKENRDSRNVHSNCKRTASCSSSSSYRSRSNSTNETNKSPRRSISRSPSASNANPTPLNLRSNGSNASAENNSNGSNTHHSTAAINIVQRTSSNPTATSLGGREAKQGSGSRHASGESDLGCSPMGTGTTTNPTNSSMAPKFVNRIGVTQEGLDLLEYPFLTMKTFPPGYIQRLGGLVSCRSVKLLEGETEASKALRDSWWQEIRREIRAHAACLGCNVVVGYSEDTSICEDVVVLSACGTAAVGNLDFMLDLDSVGYFGPPFIPTAPRRLLSESDGSGGGTGTSTGNANATCSLLHLPSHEFNLPFACKVAKCLCCSRGYVPDIMFTTVEPPVGQLEINGRGCLLQAKVLRLKRDLKGENNAKEISDALPFLEYEIHKQLVNKLKVKGMNAIFGLKTSMSMSDRTMVQTATATGVFLKALAAPSPPRLVMTSATAANHRDDQQYLQRMQRRLEEKILENVSYYGLKGQVGENSTSGASSGTGTGGSSATRTKSNASELQQQILDDLVSENNEAAELEMEPSSDHDFLIGNKDTCVLEIDDSEDSDLVDSLMDKFPPPGIQVFSTEDLVGIAQGHIVKHVQMFSQIWRGRLHPTSKDLTKICQRLMSTVYFKLRRLKPCLVSNFNLKADLDEENELQLSLHGACISLAHDGKTRRELELELASLEDSSRDSLPSPTLSHKALLRTSSRPAAKYVTKNNFYTETKNMGSIILSPLSFIPGAKIEKYLGNLNFFLIRETSSLREVGGPSNFVQSFISEIYAIVRAHVHALGGNGLVSYFMSEFVVMHNPHKNQAQCLIHVGGDSVLVSYFPMS